MSILCWFLRVYFDVSKRVKTTSPIDMAAAASPQNMVAQAAMMKAAATGVSSNFET